MIRIFAVGRAKVRIFKRDITTFVRREQIDDDLRAGLQLVIATEVEKAIAEHAAGRLSMIEEKAVVAAVAKQIENATVEAIAARLDGRTLFNERGLSLKIEVQRS